MVAIIKSSRSAKRSCAYNEKKVETGLASCIMAGNYPCEADDLTPKQRMIVLQKRLNLNERCQKGCLHIVLSFHENDKLTVAQLREISQTYMDHIGLGQQPFLVYQHLDTLHPHLHLVAVTVKADGSGNSVFHAREAATKGLVGQIEKDYQLTVSQGRKTEPGALESAQKLQYGKTPAALAISKVLSVVLPHFKYCSITELNAVLAHYNLIAKTGRPGSKTYLHRGLAYQMLSEQGQKIGTPIKASHISGKPTMNYLDQRFKENSLLIASYQQRIRTLIELALISPQTRSLAGLGQYLAGEGVKAVYAYRPGGQLSEIIFVDFRTRSVCSASRLGNRYSPAELLARFAKQEKAFAAQQQGYQNPLVPARPAYTASAHEKKVSGPENDEGLLTLLLLPAPSSDYLPWELKKRPRKKRKQISLQIH